MIEIKSTGEHHNEIVEFVSAANRQQEHVHPSIVVALSEVRD